jgi:hypothetical protein
MEGTAIVFVAIGFYVLPVELERGTHETRARSFDLPVDMSPEYRAQLSAIRLWVSKDQGRSWKLHAEMKPDGVRFSVNDVSEGIYCFCLQTVQKDGKTLPAELTRSEVTQRVFVNPGVYPVIRARTTAFRAIPPASGPAMDAASLERLLQSHDKLASEVQALRADLQEVQKRLKELEGRTSPR